MSAMSNYLENALVNATLRNTTYTSPATVYVGLYTSDPTDAGSDWRRVQDFSRKPDNHIGITWQMFAAHLR